jgi:hypothetical protein
MTRIALLAAFASLALAGCGGASGTAPASAAVVVIECPVRDAALWIDERFVAELGEIRGGVRLPSGRHRVEVRHDRYHAFYGEVALAPGDRRALKVELAELLD